MKKESFIGSSLVGIVVVGVLLFTLLGGQGVDITTGGWLSFESGVTLAAGVHPGGDVFTGKSYQGGTLGGYAKVEPSGCEEYHGNVKIRFDFFLNPEDYRYEDRHLFMVDETSVEYLVGYPGKLDEFGRPKNMVQYEKWIDGLPHIWIDIPFHSHFIYVSPDTTDVVIGEIANRHLANFYTAWCQDWIDIAGGIRHGWDVADRIRPTRYSEILEASEYNVLKTDCEQKIEEIKGLSIITNSGEGGKIFPATEIDIGSPAIDRTSTLTDDYTRIILDNPANDTGLLTTVEIWAYLIMHGCRAGTFYGSGASYTSRDSNVIGDVTSGSKQTFSGLDISVTSGDYIGAFWSGGSIERSIFGSAGMYYKEGNQFGQGTQTYDFASGDTLSLYGTGDTEPPCSEDISSTPSGKAWGTVNVNATTTTTLDYFTITNNSGGAVTITIQATDFTGGDDTWDLSDTATAGEDIYGLKAGLEGGDFTIIVKEDAAYNTLVAGLADSGTQDWGLKLYMPTSVTNYDLQLMSATVTLVASCD